MNTTLTSQTRLLSAQDIKETTAVEVSQAELINIRQHAWQNGVSIKVKQTINGPIIEAPSIYLMITGFLDDESRIINPD